MKNKKNLKYIDEIVKNVIDNCGIPPRYLEIKDEENKKFDNYINKIRGKEHFDTQTNNKPKSDD